MDLRDHGRVVEQSEDASLAVVDTSHADGLGAGRARRQRAGGADVGVRDRVVRVPHLGRHHEHHQAHQLPTFGEQQRRERRADRAARARGRRRCGGWAGEAWARRRCSGRRARSPTSERAPPPPYDAAGGAAGSAANAVGRGVEAVEVDDRGDERAGLEEGAAADGAHEAHGLLERRRRRQPRRRRVRADRSRYERADSLYPGRVTECGNDPARTERERWSLASGERLAKSMGFRRRCGGDASAARRPHHRIGRARLNEVVGLQVSESIRIAKYIGTLRKDMSSGETNWSFSQMHDSQRPRPHALDHHVRVPTCRRRAIDRCAQSINPVFEYPFRAAGRVCEGRRLWACGGWARAWGAAGTRGAHPAALAHLVGTASWMVSAATRRSARHRPGSRG